MSHSPSFGPIGVASFSRTRFWTASLLAVVMALTTVSPVLGQSQTDGERVCAADPLLVMPFSDVSVDAPSCVAIAELAQAGIAYGRVDGTFSQHGVMTRGAMAAMLYRAAGSPVHSSAAGFRDVAADALFAREIAWAAANGIVLGLADDTFDPNGVVTRGAMAAMLYRAAGSPVGSVSPVGFRDVAADALFAREIAWFAVNGFTVGLVGDTFDAGVGLTRVAAAGVLAKFVTKPTNTETPVPPAPGPQAAPEAAFVTTWDTTKGADPTVTLGLAGTVNASIDWGDGSALETVTTAGPHVHTYASEGIYTVRVTGTVTGYDSLSNGGAASERAKLVAVNEWGTTGFTSFKQAFHSATNLSALPFDGRSTRDVTDMRYMFQDASSLTTVPLFDTGNVTTMRQMFRGASSLTTVPLFNTVAVIDMGSMFQDASSLTSAPLFDTANVGSMRGMFWGASSLTSVPLFDTSNVGNMAFMFSGASSLTSVPLFNTAALHNMRGMFQNASSLTSVPLFDTTNVTTMESMFSGASSLTSVPLFDTANVITMAEMFSGASSLTSVPLFDTANVITMAEMFFGATSLTTVPRFHTVNVIIMDGMFHQAGAFNADLSDWCVQRIFSKPLDFDTDATDWNQAQPAWGTCPEVAAFVTTWDTTKGADPTVTLGLAGTVNASIDWGDGSALETVTTAGPHVHTYAGEGIYTVRVTGTVTGYDSFSNGGAASERAKLVAVNEWGTTGFTSFVQAFRSATNLSALPFDGRGTSDVTNMRNMFTNASSLTTVRWFDTGNVTTMSQMFWGASSLTTVPLLNTINVAEMDCMFGGASSLTSVPLFDTANVTTMQCMFFHAGSLTSVPLFDTADVTNMGGMFQNASSLTSVPLFNTANVTNMNSMFNGAASFTADLSGWCVTNIATKPTDFDTGATAWVSENSRPVWGTCPA